MRTSLLRLVCVSFLLLSQASAGEFDPPRDLAPKTWVVAGPFPFTWGDQPHPGLMNDFLAGAGGEAVARLSSDQVVTFDGKTFAPRAATLDLGSILDFKKFFTDAGAANTDNSVAYAYGELEVPQATKVLAKFGSDDSAMVWINGKEVHRAINNGRMISADSDTFAVEFQPGVNRILVKVENGAGGWGFGMRLFDDAAQAQLRAIDTRRRLERLDPAPSSNSFYLFEESFPQLEWREPAGAKVVFGDAPMRVRWFDPKLNEVELPMIDGRYVALVEAQTVDGYTHRRMLTFLKIKPEDVPRFRAPPNALPPQIRPPDHGAFKFSSLNEAQQQEISRHLWDGLAKYYWQGEAGAVAVAALREMESSAPSADEPLWLQSGFLRNAQHQLDLRMKLEDRVARSFPPPQRLAPPAPVLRYGSESQAGFKPGTVQKLRALCASEWLKDDPNPFVVLVARRGVVVMHEGFGGFDKGTKFYPASIGKAIAGLTFARAVDQGLLQFDQPVGDVLPDFKSPAGANVTFRWCFNHLLGFAGHSSHGGLFNAYLDNALFVEDLVFTRPGTQHRYNGDTYNLAGMAMELTTGKVMARILYEQMQKPFGEDVTQFDLGFGDEFTAMYLAKVGQMLLQDGAYGDYRFYRAGLAKELMPKKVVEFAPELNDESLEWGIGFTWMPDPEGPRENGILGADVFGHGAASQTVWRIDPEHELVVVVGRDAGKDWGGTLKWAAKFMQILSEGMEP